MKWIKYRQLVGNAADGKEVFQEMGVSYSEANEEKVKEVAYKGEYVLEEDGLPEPVEKPTQLDAIEAQVAYTAMMTDTLLEV